MRLLALLFPALVLACGTADDAMSAEDAGRSDAFVPPPPPHALPPPPPASSDAGADADAASSPCPLGSTLRRDRTACAGTPLVAPPALASALASGSTGDVVSMAGMDEGTAPCLPAVACTPDDAPRLLFSDSPELPATDGVLYADTPAAGRQRIYVYHANGGTALRKVAVVALNQGTTDATITIARRGVGGPSQAYVTVGKDVLAQWLAPMTPVVVTVPAGQRVLVDPLLDAKHAAKDELVHAIYDVITSATLKISVVTVGAAVDAAAATAGLALLPRDGAHDRGTFANADVLLVPTPGGAKTGVQKLRLGGDDLDADLTGTDATTGAAAKLVGNYGLLYRFAPGFGSRAALAPRGGAWGGVLGTTKLPTASESLATTTDAIVLGDVSSASLATAGGSNLPVDVFFVTP